jgi:hypothetical protein
MPMTMLYEDIFPDIAIRGTGWMGQFAAVAVCHL